MATSIMIKNLSGSFHSTLERNERKMRKMFRTLQLFRFILGNCFSSCMVAEASNTQLCSPFYLFFLYQVVLKSKEIQQIVISPIIFPDGTN